MAKQTIISYIPALHQGYLKFFEQYPGQIFILDQKFIKESPRLDRDIRAMQPAQVAKMIEILGHKAKVLDDLKMLSDTEIIMPDEDVSHNFAKKHLKGRKVKFVP